MRDSNSVDDQLIELCRRLALELLRAGDLAQARAQAELLKSAPSLAGPDCYNLGGLLSLCADSARKDARVSPAQRSRLVDSYIRDALHWLRSARDVGFFNKGDVRAIEGQDSDLAILADRAEFRQLIEESRSKR
jgi:hypothetical protein